MLKRIHPPGNQCSHLRSSGVPKEPYITHKRALYSAPQRPADNSADGPRSGPSSQVVGGNDYQREVTNKWAGTPGQQGGKTFSASAEAKLGGFRDRKEGVGRGGGRGGGRFDVEGSVAGSVPGPAGRGMGALEPAWKKEQRIKEEQSREGAGDGGERQRDKDDSERHRDRDSSRYGRRERSRSRDRQPRDRRSRSRERDRDRDRQRRDRCVLCLVYDVAGP